MRRIETWAIVLSALAGAFLALAPARLQSLTSEQDALDLALLYGIRSWGLWVVAVLLGLAFWAYWRTWRRGARTAARLFLAVPLLALVAAAGLVLQSHLVPVWPELDDARYTPVDEADFLVDADMVLVVEVGGRTIAYPTAIVAYHHVVNEVVDGLPYVVTY